MNKTYYFNKEEVKEALVDYIGKKTKHSEYVDERFFELQCLTEDGKNVEFDLVSIFNMDFA